MIVSTRGIILRVTKYRETSIIVNIYTEELGLNSYIVNSVRSAKAKFKIGYFEPLNLIDITTYHKPGRNIDRINEIKSAYPIHNIRQDICKSAIAMFMVEVLNKCIIEHDKNPALFTYLFNAILALEQSPGNNSFHLQFMIKLTNYLGFGIQDANSFIELSNNSQYYDDVNPKSSLTRLMATDLLTAPIITTEERAHILDDIVHYYRTHIEMPQLKSLEVLRTIFNQGN